MILPAGYQGDIFSYNNQMINVHTKNTEVLKGTLYFVFLVKAKKCHARFCINFDQINIKEKACATKRITVFFFSYNQVITGNVLNFQTLVT